MDELRRRLPGHPGQDRPSVVVQVEHRIHRAEVHVRVEIGIDRPQVPPVAPVACAGSGKLVLPEVVHICGPFAHQPGDDIAAYAVPAAIVGCVLPQRLDQHVRVEHVDAHGRERLVRLARAARRVGGLFQEHLNAVAAGCGLHHAEVRRLRPRHRDRCDRNPRSPGHVLADHLRRVHALDVIGSADHDEAGPVFQRLVDRIRRTGLPVRSQPLLRRNRGHIVPEQTAQPPGGGQMPVQAAALVLGSTQIWRIPPLTRLDNAKSTKRQRPPKGTAALARSAQGESRFPAPPAKTMHRTRAARGARSRLVNDARRTAVTPTSSASAAS